MIALLVQTHLASLVHIAAQTLSDVATQGEGTVEVIAFDRANRGAGVGRLETIDNVIDRPRQL